MRKDRPVAAIVTGVADVEDSSPSGRSCICMLYRYYCALQGCACIHRIVDWAMY